MRAIQGKGVGREQLQRRALLAKVHIAKKELGLDDGLYRAILKEEFGVESAADLRVEELEQLVRRFEEKGFITKTRKDESTKSQVAALKEKAGQMLLHSGIEIARYRGLAKKICGVEDLRFCHDVGKIKRFLVVLDRITR